MLNVRICSDILKRYNYLSVKHKAMKIELTMTELLLIVDMIKNGTEQDNEGNDFYLMQDFLDGKDDPKSKKK